MKKFIKSAIKFILSMGVCMGFVLMCGESENALIQFGWTMFWMGEMLLSGWALFKLFPEEFKEDSYE